MNNDKVAIGSYKTVDRVNVQKKKEQKYKHWVDEKIVKQALGCYVKPGGYGLTQFCAQHRKKVPLTSLRRY